jgi:hypothetical protein
MPNEEDAKIVGNKALSTIITENEWDQIEQLKDFLEVFYQTTKRLEGNGEYVSLWMTIVNMQLLYTELLKMRDQLDYEDEDHYLKNGVAYGIEKITTYLAKVCISCMLVYKANPLLDHYRSRHIILLRCNNP